MRKTKKNNPLVIILIVLVAGAIGAFMFLNHMVSPVQKESETIVFKVEKGDTARKVANRLADEKIIRHGDISYAYVKLNNLTAVKAGSYLLDKSWDTKTIFELLISENGAQNEDVTVTIPEGIWAKEIAIRISEKTSVTEEELLTLWNDSEYIKTLMNDYPFITEDVLNEQLHVKLEGYLFPETYNFKPVTTADAITRRLLNQTMSIYQKYEKEFKASDYSIHELLTLASITQFESGKDADNKLISGVWFNRLESGMALQSSVTVCYALYDYDHWRACEVNSNYESPYNTYKYKGIPVGPVCNPGESAIASVFYPTESDYLFFIADVYGDNTVYYAKTYSEHLANINKYLK